MTREQRSVRRQGWSRPTPAFARVTTLAALVVAGSCVIGLVTYSDGSLGAAWIWTWTVVSLAVAVLPLLWGERFPRWAALIGCYLFILVTAIQMALTEHSIAAANNLVLYPMLACFTGWFFGRWVARTTVGIAFALTGAALLINSFDGLSTIWLNLILASLFCLEAAGYLRRMLDTQVRTDPLTGAMNRVGLQERMDLEIARAARISQPLLAVLLDLDDFKLVNDNHGHAAGDRILTELVVGLREVTRPYDVISRIGGDEFMLLLPSAGTCDVEDLLTRLRNRVGNIFSHGTALAVPGDTAESLTERADRNLYASKNSRKDRWRRGRESTISGSTDPVPAAEVAAARDTPTGPAGARRRGIGR